MQLKRVLPALIAACLAPPASAATYINISQTISGNYNGSSVIVGRTAAGTPVNSVQVTATSTAQLDYSDQTGGGLFLFADSRAEVLGGSFSQFSPTGCCGGIQVNDKAQLVLSGGRLDSLYLSGTAPGASGARATMTGGKVENYRGIVTNVINGELRMSGGELRSTANQSALVLGEGGAGIISGGQVSAPQWVGVQVSSDAQFSVTGGIIAGFAARAMGVQLIDNSRTAELSGGTITGGLRADRSGSLQAMPQARLSGNVLVSGGVATLRQGSLQITGGAYQPFGSSGASFLALGAGDIEILGAGLVLSGPTPGSVFLENSFNGNFYTFTQGTLRDGQTAVGLVVFDALTLDGSTTGMGGGIKLVSSVPEPMSAAMWLLGLPMIIAMRRHARPR